MESVSFSPESGSLLGANLSELNSHLRPDAALADMHKMQLARIQTGVLWWSLKVVGSLENRGLYLPFTNRQTLTL